jgi:hypothetical protein
MVMPHDAFLLVTIEKNEEAQAARWWKLDLENWLRRAGRPKFPK